MKSYRELSMLLEKKIEEAIANPAVTQFYFCGLVDSWLAFSERDTETSEEEKAKCRPPHFKHGTRRSPGNIITCLVLQPPLFPYKGE